MKSYEINYGNKATINTGNYENLSPMYNIKLIIEGNVDIKQEFQRMRELVDGELNEYIRLEKQKLRLKELKHLRFYERNGKKYPSVTSIINPDPLEIPNIDLYALRGTILHNIFERYASTGNYSFDVSNADRERLLPVCDIQAYDFKWLTEQIDLEYDRVEFEVYNDEHLYAGRCDADGLHKGGEAYFDLKSGKMSKQALDKAFMQLAAYDACNPKTWLVIICVDPNDTKKLYYTQDKEKYFKMFLKKREAFQDRFGI